MKKTPEIILVKLGGSLITDKKTPYKARPDTIRHLAKQIKKARQAGYRLIVAHGSGSFGHTSAAKYRTAFGIKRKKDVFGLAVVQQDALAINRIVNRIMIEESLPVISFVPSSFILAEKTRQKKLFPAPILKALELGALPLVFGDVVLDVKQGCAIFSGEMVLDSLTEILLKRGYSVTEVIQVGITDGVYDRKGKTIAKINPRNFKALAENFGTSEATDVTGGMKHKIEESLCLVKKGIPTYIINGQRPDSLWQAIVGRPNFATLITA